MRNVTMLGFFAMFLIIGISFGYIVSNQYAPQKTVISIETSVSATTVYKTVTEIAANTTIISIVSTTTVPPPMQTDVILNESHVSVAPNESGITVAKFYAPYAGYLIYNLTTSCPPGVCSLVIIYVNINTTMRETDPIYSAQSSFTYLPTPSEVTVLFVNPSNSQTNQSTVLTLEYEYYLPV